MGEQETVAEKFDDHALARVPSKDRKHWIGIAVMRFGQISALTQFLLGAALGFGMGFWTAFWAITLGSVILELVSIFVGIAGMREGMSTTLLVRWTGFGKVGSVLLSLILAISMIGWFGIQNEVFAKGLHEILGGPIWAWSIATGLFITFIVVFGIFSLGIAAYITVPLFLIVVFYSVSSVLGEHSLHELISMGAPGPSISLAAGTSMVAGGFIAGAIITPDLSRYNKSAADVIKQSVVGIGLGEYTIGLIGVLLAHAAKSSDVITIVMGTSGIIGTIVLISATIKINDFNLYAPSLAIVNIFDSLFNKHVNRTFVTIIIGFIGTLLSVMGILSHFQGFLSFLGIALPPVGGILIAEYFLIKRYKKAMEASRKMNRLPETYEKWNPITLLSWILAFLVGLLLEWGIPSLNSLLTGSILYWLISMIINRSRVVTFHEIDTYQDLKNRNHKKIN